MNRWFRENYFNRIIKQNKDENYQTIPRLGWIPEIEPNEEVYVNLSDV